MNASLSVHTARVSGLVERQVSAPAGKAVAVVSVTPAPARRAGVLSRFLKALTRSLGAFAA